jgi:hypothetical protein
MYSPLWIKCADLSKDNGSVVGHALEGLAKFRIFASRRLNGFCMFNKTGQPHFYRSLFLRQTVIFASPSLADPSTSWGARHKDGKTPGSQ